MPSNPHNSSAEPLEIPGYEILDLLGAGGIASVYRARQRNLDRVVALKVIDLTGSEDPAELSRAKVEARVIAKLRHPNIVTAYDYGVENNRVYLALELVEGEDLADFVESRGACDERFVWAIVRQTAAALAYAGQHKVVHRDIKPGNLLLTEPLPGFDLPPGVPMVKVTDFGLALESSVASEKTRLTVAGATLGTLAYVAPEQLQETTVDCRADIYALGATVFHMFAGVAPFANGSPMKVIVAKSTGDANWRDELPESVAAASRDLFRDMTEHNPAQRIGDYVELFARIDEILGTQTLPSLHEAPVFPKHSAGTSSAEKEIGVGRQPDKLSRTSLLKTLLVFGSLLLGAVLWNTIGGTTPEELPPITWRTGRQRAFLFDGQTLPYRGRQSGTWELARNDENVNVLMGMNGMKELPWQFPPGFADLEEFEIQLLVDLKTAEQVEVLFAGARNDDRKIAYHVVQFSNDTARVGHRASNGDLVDSSMPHPLRSRSEDNPYHALGIGHTAGRWWIRVDGELFGTFPARPGESTRQITLKVEGGSALFSDLLVYEVLSQNDVSGGALEPASGADGNGNGAVNAADYVVWRKTLDQTGDYLAADGNSNGTIDASDYDVWRAHFGQMAGAGAAAGSSSSFADRVPEPASMLLTGMAALVVCALRCGSRDAHGRMCRGGDKRNEHARFGHTV